MASNVKKGFGTYLFILFLMVVAAFLITCVVMIFQPFKVILGYKYIAYNDDSGYCYNLTFNSASPINIQNKDIIRVSSSYATVKLEKDATIDDFAVVITNKVKGFARASQDTDFSYSIDESIDVASDGSGVRILDITIDEPEGFLFFQKNVEIKLCVPYFDTDNNAHDLSGKKIIITTDSGTVLLGNQFAINEDKKDQTHSNNEINPSNIAIQTKSGNIYLYSNFDDSNLVDVNIRTSSGHVNSGLDIDVSNKFSFRTDNGSFSVKKITASTSDIVLNNGKFSVDEFNCSLNFSTISGEINIQKVAGSVNSNNSAIPTDKGRIVIGEVTASVSMPFLANCYVKIDKIKGQCYMEGEGCSINIGEVRDVAWIKTTTGNVYAYTKADDITVQSTTGNVEVYFASETIENKLNFGSTSGSIKLHVLPSLACKMQFFDTNGNLRTKDVKVEPFEKFKNPTIVNSGEKEILFNSNGRISVTTFTLA